jgi:lipoprotein NlpI
MGPFHLKNTHIIVLGLFITLWAAGCAHTNCGEITGKGLTAYQERQYDQALEFYSAALECENNAEKRADLHYRRGLVWEKKNDPMNSLDEYSAAITLNPDLARAYSHRGVVRAQMGDLERAVIDFNRLVALEPQNPSAFNNRALVRRQLGDSDRAIADYTRAIALNPGHAYTYLLRSFAYESVGLYALAQGDMWQYIKLSTKGGQAIEGPDRDEVQERLEMLRKLAEAATGVATISGIEILEYGQYEIGTSPAAPGAPDAPGGLAVSLVRSTEIIPAEVGSRFGFRFRIEGAPQGAPVKISVVVIFPEPGMQIPGKSTITPDLRYHFKTAVGETAYFSYLLEHFWQVMQGPWSFELWCQGRRLAQKTFTLEEPTG